MKNRGIISCVIMIMFMIIGLSSNARAQSDTTISWKVVSACLHDSQDQHLYNTDVSESYTITATAQDTTTLLVINDPERERKYTLTGPIGIERGFDRVKLYFYGIDDKLVECEVIVTLFMNDNIRIRVAYPNLILHWGGISIKEEPKIQANTNI